MNVDASHREITQIYPIEIYESLSQRCVEALQATKIVSSVVLCGSLAKSDIVPGWSDLDIIVFLPCTCDSLSGFHIIKKALNQARADIQIGIGVDIVYDNEFKRTSRLCGRPLAMSYEVAAYGKICFGLNPFENLRYSEDILEKIESDRFIAIAAELHNWRRAFLAYDPQKDDFKKWAARCIKTMLKLLKYETDPNIEPPFTYEGSLDRLKNSRPDYSLIDAFACAVKIRKSWPYYIDCVSELKNETQFLSETLANYTFISNGE